MLIEYFDNNFSQINQNTNSSLLQLSKAKLFFYQNWILKERFGLSLRK